MREYGKLFSYGDSGWGRSESGKEETGVFGKCATWLKLIRGMVEAVDRMDATVSRLVSRKCKCTTHCDSRKCALG